MITFDSYFGSKLPLAPAEHQVNARMLLGLVNLLLTAAERAESCEYKRLADPDTGTCIAGSNALTGDGGYRLPTSRTGTASSKHRTGHAVDVYDPGNHLDDWLTDERLEQYGLWRERPEMTPGWSHLQDIVTLTGQRSS